MAFSDEDVHFVNNSWFYVHFVNNGLDDCSRLSLAPKGPQAEKRQGAVSALFNLLSSGCGGRRRGGTATSSLTLFAISSKI